jgi:hypothetical protein
MYIILTFILIILQIFLSAKSPSQQQSSYQQSGEYQHDEQQQQQQSRPYRGGPSKSFSD